MGVFLDLGSTACHWGNFKVILKEMQMSFEQAAEVLCLNRQGSLGSTTANRFRFVPTTKPYCISAVRSNFEQNNYLLQNGLEVANNLAITPALLVMSSVKPHRKAGMPAINLGVRICLILVVEVKHATVKSTTIDNPPIRGVGLV